MNVVFEFYGTARLRSGLERVGARGATLGEALADLIRALPALEGTIVEGGRLGRHYRLSLNGRRFVSDPAEPLADGDSLIVMAAEAGG
jgi:molybdopterin converting factor small subunit